MDFERSSEQIPLRKTEVTPHVLGWDEGRNFPREAIGKIAGRGGAGVGYIEHEIIVEKLARIGPAVAPIVAAHTENRWNR